MWPNSILILHNTQENQPLIPRRNPPVRGSNHGEVDRRPCCDPSCCLYYTFILILVLLLFIYGRSPSTAKLESEGMYTFFVFSLLQFSTYSLEYPKCQKFGSSCSQFIYSISIQIGKGLQDFSELGRENYSFLKVENVEIFIYFPHYGNFLLHKLNSCRGNY